jgi:hypothetical protein
MAQGKKQRDVLCSSPAVLSRQCVDSKPLKRSARSKADSVNARRRITLTVVVRSCVKLVVYERSSSAYGSELEGRTSLMDACPHHPR